MFCYSPTAIHLGLQREEAVMPRKNKKRQRRVVPVSQGVLATADQIGRRVQARLERLNKGAKQPPVAAPAPAARRRQFPTAR